MIDLLKKEKRLINSLAAGNLSEVFDSWILYLVVAIGNIE